MRNQLIFSLAQAGSTYMLDHDHTGARRELKFLFNSVDIIIIIMWVSERYVNEITRMWKSPSHFSQSLDEDDVAQPPLSRSCRWFSRNREPSIFSPLSSSGLTYKVDSRLEYLFSINSILNSIMLHHYHSVVWRSRLSDSDIINANSSFPPPSWISFSLLAAFGGDSERISWWLNHNSSNNSQFSCSSQTKKRNEESFAPISHSWSVENHKYISKQSRRQRYLVGWGWVKLSFNWL